MFSSTEDFLLIVCGSIPTLKPLYDMVHGFAKSALQSVPAHISSKPYGNDSTPKRSHRLSLDPRNANRSYRIGSKDQSFGTSTRIDAGPAAKIDSWNNDDDHTLLEMGDIAVKSRWEVTRERRGSGLVPVSQMLGRPAHFKSTVITGDNAV